MPDAATEALSGGVLAFDYGTAKTGVAVGDMTVGHAHPLAPLGARRGQPDWTRLLAVIAEWQPRWLVVGLPLRADGSDCDISRRARRFALTLSRKSGLPCSLSDERLTSAMARAEQRAWPDSNATADSLAAKIILCGWLNGPRPRREPELADRLGALRARVASAALRAQRRADAVRVVAASKAQPVDRLRAAHAEGVVDFGENYATELEQKAAALADRAVCWHFIGGIQRNKTRLIAQHCDWVHSIASVAVARRLSEQRPAGTEALHCCVQLAHGAGARRAGAAPEDIAEIARQCHALPGLRLRGLMVMPTPDDSAADARRLFGHLAATLAGLRAAPGLQGAQLDTLSMGMSADLEHAVAAGATAVRVGSALFGPRDPPAPLAADGAPGRAGPDQARIVLAPRSHA